MGKCGRNDPCPCGSGKKYKKCCGQKKGLSQRSFSQLTSRALQGNINSLSSKIMKTVQVVKPEKKENLSDRVKPGAAESQKPPNEEASKEDKPLDKGDH